MRHVLVRTGVICFWAALALEFRAMEVWREQRAQRALVRRHRRHSEGSLRLWGERVSNQISWRHRDRCPSVLAWSLPDSRRMRGLGLGHMWAVLCPYCDEFHTQSPGEGQRTPHCCNDRSRPQHYVLAFAGAMPVEHRTRFYRSSKSDLPRLLHHWPEVTAQRSEDMGLLAA